MDGLTKTRGLIYVLGLAGSVIAALGYADFDVATGAFDLRPINLYALVGIGANALAVVAVAAGWGGKK